MNIARSLMLLGCLWVMRPGDALAEATGHGCDHHVAQWLDPASGEPVDSEGLFARLASKRMVLLGEAHTNPEHHRWQAYVLAALHSRHSNMVLGFEMLPRRAQPVLDAWSAGDLTEEALLERSDWQRVWGYDADLYLPLFHFARLNRLPTVALNVDRALISLVGSEGWKAVPEEQRAGLSDPAPASDEYRRSLARLVAYKKTLTPGAEPMPMSDIEPGAVDEVMGSEDFSNFVDAQLTWDRAMAEALAAAHRRDPAALVVGIVGRGHLEYGYGIPHQLSQMGIDEVSVLLPLDAGDTCDPLPPKLAAAVFVVDAYSEDHTPAARPLLGVAIEAATGGVRVTQVMDDSVAARSGLAVDDLIESAAGFEMTTPADLVEVVVRQAPGTWLPLSVLRGEQRLEILARFPQSFATHP